MITREIFREADLISRAAIYHAVQMVIRPPLSATHNPLVQRFNRLMKPRKEA